MYEVLLDGGKPYSKKYFEREVKSYAVKFLAFQIQDRENDGHQLKLGRRLFKQ